MAPRMAPTGSGFLRTVARALERALRNRRTAGRSSRVTNKLP